MNTRIELALAWKEIRQSFPILLAFSLLSLFSIVYAYYLHHSAYGKNFSIQNVRDFLSYFAFFISLGLAYLSACGNRVLEAGDNLEAFLFTRPVERRTLIKVYYTIGLTEILIWLAFFLLTVFVLFGINVFMDEGKKMALYEVYYFYYLFWLLAAHGVTFCVSLIYPNLVATSTAFLLSYLGIMGITMFPEKLFIALRETSVYVPSLALLIAAIFGAFYLYNQKQIS